EFHRTCHCHRDYSYPRGCHAAGPHGATARPDIHKREGNRPVTASVTPPAPTGGGTSKPAAASVGQNHSVEKCRNYLSGAIQSRWWPPALPARTIASSGKSVASSPASVHGGLTAISPQPARGPASCGGAIVSSAHRIFAMPLRASRRASVSGSARPLIGYHNRKL